MPIRITFTISLGFRSFVAYGRDLQSVYICLTSNPVCVVLNITKSCRVHPRLPNSLRIHPIFCRLQYTPYFKIQSYMNILVHFFALGRQGVVLPIALNVPGIYVIPCCEFFLFTVVQNMLHVVRQEYKSLCPC